MGVQVYTEHVGEQNAVDMAQGNAVTVFGMLGIGPHEALDFGEMDAAEFLSRCVKALRRPMLAEVSRLGDELSGGVRWHDFGRRPGVDADYFTARLRELAILALDGVIHRCDVLWH